MSNLIGIKKAWSPTAVVPLLEALALPISLEQQREAHAEYKITLVPYFDCLRYAHAHTYIRKKRTIIGTRGITLYPVGHLSLLSSGTN